MIELLLLADVNFPEHKVYFVCPSVPGKDRKSWTNDTFPDCNKIRITAIVGRGKFNKLGSRSQLREAKLEDPWLGKRD